jgi:hypothetical protein
MKFCASMIGFDLAMSSSQKRGPRPKAARAFDKFAKSQPIDEELSAQVIL